MLYEWGYHNRMYVLNIFLDRSGSVDLDAKDENKPFLVKGIEILYIGLTKRTGDIFD